MGQDQWTATFNIYRQKGTGTPTFEKFTILVDPDEYVLDGIERIWAYEDRNLVFRHACHHSACGACGMRVNGVEKLTCITPIREVVRDGGTLKIEPLRNFPVFGDLVVDMREFYQLMEKAHYAQVVPVGEAPQGHGIHPARTHLPGDEGMFRLADCLECGMCISACPIEQTTPEYFGPGVLAAIQSSADNHPELLCLADSQDGVWRCHSAFECSEVCPSFVEPGWRIMDLRRRIITQKVKRFFGVD
jgi:succinate dehydrogenase / fumarate reductase iron-sulfur subunit